MTRDFQIVDSTPEHARALASRLRADDALEITSVGESPQSCLWHSFRGSPYRRTTLMDGQVIAMWGVHGDLLGDRGTPWLLTAPEVERVPVAMLRVGRAETGHMLDLYPRLENYVMASYRRAVRFIALMGFTVEAPTLVKGVPFRRFWLTQRRSA